MKQFKKYVFLLTILPSYFFGMCSGDQVSDEVGIANAQDIAEVRGIPYASTEFIGTNRVFNDESLNKISAVRLNPVTNQIIVIDKGNHAAYSFSLDGEFIKTIGEMGQGPGNLYGPRHLDFDDEGNIYINEELNKRMSIFDKDGHFSHILKFSIYPGAKFTVTADKRILINDRHNGYYIAVYSDQGEVLQKVGKLETFNDNPRVNIAYGKGVSFINEDNNFVFFLQNFPLVKVFDPSGNLIENITNNQLLNIRIQKYTKEVIRDLSIPIITQYFWDVSYTNNMYYILRYDYDDRVPKEEKLYIARLDYTFNLNKKIVLPPRESPINVYGDQMRFEVWNEGSTFLVAYPKLAAIYKFIESGNEK